MTAAFLKSLLVGTFALSMILGAGSSAPLYSQSEENVDFPPPLKTLSRAERTVLQSEKDPRKRMTVALDLIETRLKRAESAYAKSLFTEAFFEIGAFEGLIENTLNFLLTNNQGKDSDFNNLKRFEISLRSYTPRIEVLRRVAPDFYQDHLQSVLKQIRDWRSRAVEPMFGDNVVPRERRENNEQK